MVPLTHLWTSLILAAMLYPLFGWKALLVAVGGVLIDIDHYFWYILKYKRFSLLGCYAHFAEQIRKRDFSENIGELFIFHTAEFMFASALLSFYNKWALIFTIGLLLHYLLDLIWHIAVPKRIIVNHSIIWWLIKNKFK